MEFRIAKAARVTGQMLERLVREKLQAENIPEPNAVVCYGVGYTGPQPALNARCTSMNKMEQGVALFREFAGNEESLIIIPANETDRIVASLPVVGRKIKHAKGKDIRVCKNARQVALAVAKGREFFTPIVDSDTEYRVWVYRKRVLAVYEKRLTEPENNTKFGRNRANGWTFHALGTDDIPESVRDVSKRAVAALGLDFGAVDVLGKWEDEQHTDVHATVLEVNSAPGVSDEHRSCIVKLTNRVVRWVANGCPAREA